MLTESIIVAIITGVFAVIGQYLIARENKRKSDTEQAVKDALLEQRLDNLEGKLDEAISRIDEHNGLADKFREVSQNFNVAIAELRTELKLKRQQ